MQHLLHFIADAKLIEQDTLSIMNIIYLVFDSYLSIHSFDEMKAKSKSQIKFVMRTIQLHSKHTICRVFPHLYTIFYSYFCSKSFPLYINLMCDCLNV